MTAGKALQDDIIDMIELLDNVAHHTAPLSVWPGDLQLVY